VSVVDRFDAWTPEAKAAALEVLDDMSRPLSAREIERALRQHGVAKSRATLFAASLRKLNIIAVIGPEDRP
jgi:repressor of nif and glnA expression